MAIFRARGGRSLTTRPPIRMSPEVWVSSPAIILSSVVLPHPDGPRRTRNSPSLIVRSTPSTAVWPVNSLRSALVSTVAIGQREGSGLDELPLGPLLPDLLVTLLGLLDRRLGRERAGGGLGEHGVQQPGAVPVVDGRRGVAGEADVGRPVERVGENRVLVGRLPLGVLGDQLLEIRHLLLEAGEVVELALREGLVEVPDVVDQELLRPVDVLGELPDHVHAHHVLEAHCLLYTS